MEKSQTTHVVRSQEPSTLTAEERELALARKQIEALTSHNRELLRALQGLDETRAVQYRDRRRLNALIENAPLCVHEIGLDGTMQSINRKGLSMLQATDESNIVGTPYLDSVDEADRERIRTLMTAAFRGHAADFVFATTGEEGTRTFSSCFVPIFDELAQVERLMGCTRDITHQLALEDSKQDLQRQVLHVQKLESLGLLAGGVAHDFNNMLAAIMGNLEISRILTGPDHPAADSISAAQNAVDLGANLCRQLLAYAGKGRFGIQPLDLGAAAQKVASMLRASLPSATIITIEATEQVFVDASAGQIDQVILNLLVNAADAQQGQAGRILLTVKSTTLVDGQFESSVGGKVRAGEYAECSVTDEGVGIASDAISSILDPFFSTKDSGRGLGLAAVGGIIRGHQGLLRIKSTVGKGSQFSVFLPLSTRVPMAAQDSAAIEPKGMCILVVDDDERVLSASAGLLAELGFDTVKASSGVEAIDYVKKDGGRFSAVLLDVSMPGLSGPRTLETLKEVSPELPVILSSGWEQSEFCTTIADETTFLAKPYSLAELMSALASVLQKAE